MSAAGVPLTDWHGKDPRLSAAQTGAFADLVCVDEYASILGFDWAYLPVVEAILGMPARVRRYAVARDGSPTLVNYGPVVVDPWAGPAGGHNVSLREDRIVLRGDGGEHADGKLLETWAVWEPE